MNPDSPHPCSDLPPLYIPEYFIPQYRAGESGPWKITHFTSGFERGYFSGLWRVQNMPVLQRRNQDSWETWMSLSPQEMESQEPAIQYAAGHTVIMGLGLGWLALNAAFNENVSQVTVIELDRDIIRLFNRSGAMDPVPKKIRQKIHIIHGDALKWTSKKPVDFLYADIWQSFAEDGVLDDLQRMQTNLHAELIYFWGQEIVLDQQMKRSGAIETHSTSSSISAWVRDRLGLPLLIPDPPDYAERIQTVIGLRKERGLL